MEKAEIEEKQGPRRKGVCGNGGKKRDREGIEDVKMEEKRGWRWKEGCGNGGSRT